MNLGVTDRLRPILDAVRRFIDERVIPVEDEYLAEVANGDRWSLNERQTEITEGLMNTLHLKGAKSDIRVNCRVPTTGTAMTEGLFRAPIFKLMWPDAVSPVMVFLSGAGFEQPGKFAEQAAAKLGLKLAG
jgi:hypothetical protein